MKCKRPGFSVRWQLFIGLALISFFLLFVGVSWVWLPHDPAQVELHQRLLPPNEAHWLGTDHLGRDLLSRVWAGAGWTLGCALLIMSVSVILGVAAGLVSGYLGGRADALFMRIIDSTLAFPDVLIALAITGLLGPGILNICLAMIVVKWIHYARLVRSIVLVEKKKEYILYARASGTRLRTILFSHLLPQVQRHVLALSTIDMGKVILMISAFSYMGLGVQPPTPEWGALLSEGRTYFQTFPRLMVVPGLAIFLLVWGFNLVGDALSDRWGSKKTGLEKL
ncbi:nickel transporter permease [Lihuaxuella thermophila]|uniref:Peptide/nickel transport system permease protein n=1 Tax=Lihuaxuella thermophila TaxID=1173111 RepID=A0A1H8BHQ8_9BACL|nr:nickel transporter permease [Lihuaxuella thermophila]SEM82480.1 peptide/nickel transport system permease protein [Lihuaxuella thermophila]